MPSIKRTRSGSSSNATDGVARQKLSSSNRTGASPYRSSMLNWISGEPEKKCKAVGSEIPSTAYVLCPVCSISLSVGMMNVHLDSCLVNSKDISGRLISTEEKVDEDCCSLIAGSEPTNIITPVEHSELPGLWLLHEFISEEEEANIVSLLDSDQTLWHHSSFNGNTLSKSFGVKTQFGPAHIEERIVRKNDPERGEHGVPLYLSPCVDRLKGIVRRMGKKCKMPTVLSSFKPNECNANLYLRSENHSLSPHYDDRFLSGPILMNLSLHGRSRMTYSKGDSDAFHDKVVVELPRRCLQLVTGDARYKYKHRIDAEDIIDDKRISITWRQAGDSNGGLIRGQAPGASSSSLATFLSQSNKSEPTLL